MSDKRILFLLYFVQGDEVMDILSSLRLVVDYIENSICDEINISVVARECAMSEYELSNLFHSLTGMTIKEYIRKRKLTLAGLELQNSNEKIIDIAIKYGYDSADSFRRAFIAQHSVSPSKAKIKNTTLNIYPPLSFEIKVKGANKMNFKIVDIDGFEVWGLTEACFSSDSSRYEFARDMWSDECQHLPEKICDGYDGIWYAIWTSSNYSIARDKSNCTKPDLTKIVIPSGKYAVFTTDKGGYAGDELPKLHEQIFESWLPESDYIITSDFELEIYHLATDKDTRRKERYYEIWIPITEKSNGTRNKKVVIRNAESKDTDDLAKICNDDLGYNCNSKLVERGLSMLNGSREQVFVAETNGKVVGFVHIELYNLIYCEPGTNILGLAVSSDFQRQGIGKALMQKAEEWAKQNASAFVRLNSALKRKGAHEFYRSLGYDNEKEQIRFIKMI